MKTSQLWGIVLFLAALASPAAAVRMPAEAHHIRIADLGNPFPSLVSDGNNVQTVSPQAGLTMAATPAETPWDRFRQKHGPWAAKWNRTTRTPHFASGKPVALSSQPLDSNNIEAACRDFIRSNEGVFGTTPERLHKLQVVKAGGRWYAAFEQMHNDVPVLGATVRMSFTKDDKLVALGSDAYQNIDVNTTPQVTAKAALRVALADSRKEADKYDRVSEAKLYVVPQTQGAGITYSLCWQVEVLQSSIQKKWDYLIDARDGKVLSRKNTLWYGNCSGTVMGEYKPEFASDTTQVEGFPDEKISAEGQEQTIQTWSFDTDPGWLTEGMWAFGVPTGGGSHCGDPTSGATGMNVYGYNLNGDYYGLGNTTKYLTTTAIDCQGQSNLRLKFMRWLGVEGYDWDRAIIESSANMQDWNQVWLHGGAETCDSAWVPVMYDIPNTETPQTSLFIRWGMGPQDQSITFPGWNIDDVELATVLGGFRTTYTQANGAFVFDVPWEPSTVSSGISGRYSTTQNAGGPDSKIEFWPVYSGSQLDWTWDATTYNSLDESNVYRHMNRAHSYYKSLDPGFSGLDYSVPAWVNVNFSNAYWDGYGLAFGRGDGVDWDDFSLYCDVVYHEYTHGVTDKIYTGFPLPYAAESGAMNEGWSDYFGCVMSPSQKPLIGDGGLLIQEPWLRTLENSYRRETDWVNESHADSEMFSGSLWDARTAAGGDVMDVLVHYARYAHATTFEDFLTALLVEDDTRFGDGDLSNGTPHCKAIFDGFGKHGMGGLQYVPASILVSRQNRRGTSAMLEPGDDARLWLSLDNGWADARNIRATLTSTDPNVRITKSVANFKRADLGDVTDNAGDPFKVRVSSNCPETHTLRFTLTVTADGPYRYSRTCLVYCNVGVKQIAYDDGQPDESVSFGQAGGGLAVKMTPPSYPAYPTHVRLFPMASTDITVVVWAADANGNPAGRLGSMKVHPPAVNDWWDVDITQLGLVIRSGSVFVGWVEGEGAYANGFDYDPPYYTRSWLTYEPAWAHLEPFGLLGNFMVRMRYADKAPLLINPPQYTTWCPGKPVRQCLTASHGMPPYGNWTALPLPPGYGLSMPGVNMFLPTGVAQGFQDDDAVLKHALPFAFPYYGKSYSSINISTNGFITLVDSSLAYANSTQRLIDNVIISPLWDDLVTYAPGDIYIDESIAGQITIRWSAMTFRYAGPANFSATLFADGGIRFDYGDGNTGLSPTIGISNGDGQGYVIVASYDGAATLTNANSVLFMPLPSRPSLPDGMTIGAATGYITGTPQTPGTYNVTISVTDHSQPPHTARRSIAFTVGYRGSDLNQDCGTDFIDYAMVAASWRGTGCSTANSWCTGADIDHSGAINWKDISAIAQDWLKGR
jgi:Zn-dependent metalloprotease